MNMIFIIIMAVLGHHTDDMKEMYSALIDCLDFGLL